MRRFDLSRIKKLPPPALVVAMIALFVAFSGTSYAAVKIARNSITSIHVKDRSLLAKDFKSGQIPRGPAGPACADPPAGPAGPAGPTGPAGAGEGVCPRALGRRRRRPACARDHRRRRLEAGCRRLLHRHRGRRGQRRRHAGRRAVRQARSAARRCSPTARRARKSRSTRRTRPASLPTALSTCW